MATIDATQEILKLREALRQIIHYASDSPAGTESEALGEVGDIARLALGLPQRFQVLKPEPAPRLTRAFVTIDYSAPIPEAEEGTPELAEQQFLVRESYRSLVIYAMYEGSREEKVVTFESGDPIKDWQAFGEWYLESDPSFRASVQHSSSVDDFEHDSGIDLDVG